MIFFPFSVKNGKLFGKLGPKSRQICRLEELFSLKEKNTFLFRSFFLSFPFVRLYSIRHYCKLGKLKIIFFRKSKIFASFAIQIHPFIFLFLYLETITIFAEKS